MIQQMRSAWHTDPLEYQLLLGVIFPSKASRMYIHKAHTYYMKGRALGKEIPTRNQEPCVVI